MPRWITVKLDTPSSGGRNSQRSTSMICRVLGPWLVTTGAEPPTRPIAIRIPVVRASARVPGRYAEAERLIGTHRFAPRHRSYGLRDKYRLMRFGMGARLFGEGDFAGALKMFDSALAPPESLGADDFESQPLPIQQYFRGRALERLGKAAEARKAYERAVEGVALLSGDRDSWSPENFYMVLALDRLGRKGEPAAIEKRFEDFANGELNARNAQHRAVAAYVLALVRRHQGRDAESAELLKRALEAAPDYLPARLLSR